MGGLIGTATPGKDGLISAKQASVIANLNMTGGTSGGALTRYFKIAMINDGAYNPIFILISFGYYDTANREIFNITATINSGHFYISGRGGGVIGYAKENGNFYIYIKAGPGISFVGLVVGSNIYCKTYTTVEPSGIIYIS